MPARKKRLAGFVHDRTFLARRHARLLVEDKLLDDLELRTLQVAYRAETSALERQQLALQFEKLVRSRPHDEFTMRQELLAVLGPGPLGVGRGELSSHQLSELKASWECWDRRHGFAWRVRHGAMHNGDRLTAYRRLTRRRTRNLNRIDREVPDLEERARTELTLPNPPSPPGWDILACELRVAPVRAAPLPRPREAERPRARPRARARRRTRAPPAAEDDDPVPDDVERAWRGWSR